MFRVAKSVTTRLATCATLSAWATLSLGLLAGCTTAVMLHPPRPHRRPDPRAVVLPAVPARTPSQGLSPKTASLSRMSASMRGWNNSEVRATPIGTCTAKCTLTLPAGTG